MRTAKTLCTCEDSKADFELCAVHEFEGYGTLPARSFFSKSHEPTTGVFSLCLSSLVKPGMSRELPIALHLAFEDAWLEGC